MLPAVSILPFQFDPVLDNSAPNTHGDDVAALVNAVSVSALAQMPSMHPLAVNSLTREEILGGRDPIWGAWDSPLFDVEDQSVNPFSNHLCLETSPPATPLDDRDFQIAAPASPLCASLAPNPSSASSMLLFAGNSIDVPQPPTRSSLPIRRLRRKQREPGTQRLMPFHPTLANHWEVVNGGQVECRSCRASMLGVLSFMNAHLHESHPDIESPFICAFQNCTARFPLKSLLLSHLSDAHGGKHYCLFCPSFSINNDRYYLDITDHIRALHSGQTPPCYQCFECDSAYVRIRTLTTHISGHTDTTTTAEGNPSLTDALTPIGLQNTNRRRTHWTSSLLDLFYNHRNGLPKATPGFDQSDRALIQRALFR